MKIRFLGTRGYIEAKTARHRKHASAMISYRGTHVMIDAGLDWVKKIYKLVPQPKAIVITHAHPDHAWGLKEGSPCPVYAIRESWNLIMGKFDIPQNLRKIVRPLRTFKIGAISFKAFRVVHSTRAPAVGYRITAGKHTIFYVPDLVYIEDRAKALKGCQIYIGDGATVRGGHLVRKRGGTLIGHTSVRTQLTWCQKEGIPEMIVTHCGSEIVKGDERKIGALIRRMAKKRGVNARIAYDGMVLELNRAVIYY